MEYIYKSTQRRAHYTTADEMPRFPGGEEALLDYINNAIRDPKRCCEANIEGRTYVIFVVTSKGRITDARIHKSSGNKKLDKGALRVVRKMPRMKPAKLNGENVSVMLTMPVTFRLDNPNTYNLCISRLIVLISSAKQALARFADFSFLNLYFFFIAKRA